MPAVGFPAIFVPCTVNLFIVESRLLKKRNRALSYEKRERRNVERFEYCGSAEIEPFSFSGSVAGIYTWRNLSGREYRSLFQYYDGKGNFSISDNLWVVIDGLDGLHRFIGSLDATYWIPIGFGYYWVWCKKDPDTGIRHNRKEVQKVSQFLFDLYKIILASKEHLL